MRRWYWILFAATAVVAVAACTGTFQPGVPLALLVVDGGDAEASRVLAFAVEPPGPASPRAVRALGDANVTPEIDGPVVALDWVDRGETATGAGLGRSRVVLLVAEHAAATDGRAARVFTYDTGAFDVESPAPLALVGAPLVLVEGGLFVPEARAGVQAPDPGVCLSDVAVSLDGRFLVLLDRRSSCGAADLTDNYVLVVDTQPEEPALVWSAVAGLLPLAPVLDQSAGRFDYLTTAEVVRSRSLSDLDSSADSDTIPIGTGTVRAFTGHGRERLVVVDDRLYRVSDTGAVGAPVTTQSAVIAALETTSGLPVVLRTANRLVVHADPEDDDEHVLDAAYRSGVTDVSDQLMYLAAPGRIDTFDLLLYDPARVDPIRSVITQYPQADLPAPRFVTYFRPRPSAP